VRFPRVLGVALQILAVVYLVAIIAGVVVYKAAFIQMVTQDPFFTVYGSVVSAYIVSRFVFSLFYRSSKDHGLEPHVAVIMPAFNEEDVIARSLQSLLELDYPAEKLELVAVNDGSTDSTLAQMQEIAAGADGRVHVIDLGRNQGKRAAMAAGI